MHWKKAITASGVIAISLTLFHQISATGGMGYFRKVDWELVEAMPYKEAQKYLLERSKELTKLESLNNAARTSNFWLNALLELMFLWAVGLGSCALYEKYQRAT